MFKIKDNFSTHNENLQPYSFELEQHTYVANLHATVHDNAFHMQSVGNRYILNSPVFEKGRISFDFVITFLKEYNPVFTIYFGYNKKTRTSMGIRLRYELEGKMNAELIEEDMYCVKCIHSVCFDDFELCETKSVHFELILDCDKVLCVLGEKRFSFECQIPKGNIAIERQDFIGELIISQLEFESDDCFERTEILKSVKAQIPLVNGGDIPYEITWRIDKIENEYFMTYTLDGGTGTREYNKADRPMQFNVELDHMKNPYVAVLSSGREQKFFIANQEICFVDANVYWECQKEFFGNTALPICAVVKLDPSVFEDDKLSDDANLVFGYDNLICKGYANQQGEGEFRYDLNGNLIYSGNALDGQDVYKVFSPFDKYALKLIPKDCYKRDDVVEHIKYNHYFERKENIDFKLDMYTRLNSEYIKIQSEIQNVYETEILDCTDTSITREKYINGYSIIKANAHFGSLDTGVYKIVFKVFYGEKLKKEVKHVFEVFDENSDETPALKSGLPFLFSMANEIKWLERNAFDLWNPKPSCDSVHYISCVTDTPIEAERRKTWELIKPFKRKWFAWLAPRTCRDFRDFDAHKETIKNADYLFYALPPFKKTARCQFTQFPLRSDHWSYLTTKSGFHQDLLKEFLSENPDYAKVVDMDFENGEFTTDHFERLMKNYRQEWISYVNDHVMQIIEEQNDELAKLNPNVKRSMYGPLSVYITPTISYRSLTDYGLPKDERLSEKVFTGFNVFEDYPIACAYPTYKGPFTLTSILLHCPGAVLYPEQYREDKGGNMDGAVKYAHSPMALYSMEPYQYSTHSFEYVFNTPYRLKDGYHYWNTYGFHRRDHGPQMLEDLTKDWYNVIENKPKKPLKAMAFIAEYDESDTNFDIAAKQDGSKVYAFCNKSELGAGLIHECSRECGVPNGFQIKFDALETLSASETDILVVPSLKNADKKYIDEIRRLYNEGVNLIGLSDITGLEDIFGVEQCKTSGRVHTISYNGESESIYPSDATFDYRSCNSNVVVTLNGDKSAVICTDRTALINTDVLSLGSENKGQRDNRPNAYCTIGKIIRKALGDIILKLSNPLVYGENVGVTAFETENSNKTVMVINYVEHDNREEVTKEAKVIFNHPTKEAIVKFNIEGLIAVESKKELSVCKNDGIVKEVRFDIKPHETAFIRLIFEQ